MTLVTRVVDRLADGGICVYRVDVVKLVFWWLFGGCVDVCLTGVLFPG